MFGRKPRGQLVQFELKFEQSPSFLSRHVPVLDPRNECTYGERLSISELGTDVATLESSALDATFALLQARAALASTSELTTIPPATLAKLLVYEARDDDTPLFSLLVVVKRQAVFWQEPEPSRRIGARPRLPASLAASDSSRGTSLTMAKWSTLNPPPPTPPCTTGLPMACAPTVMTFPMRRRATTTRSTASVGSATWGFAWSRRPLALP